MRLLTSAVICGTLSACANSGGEGSDDAEGTCGYEELTQVLSGSEGDRVVPDTQEGALEEVLIGTWQHTWSYDPGLPGDAWTALSDATKDIRFAIPSTSRFIYCQRAGTDGVNESTLTINGDKLEVTGPGYTATAWTQDIMVWRNDYFTDREALYVLERLD